MPTTANQGALFPWYNSTQMQLAVTYCVCPFSVILQTCRLGQHVAITKVLRDGILRIGQKSLKLAKEPVDDWFMQQGD